MKTKNLILLATVIFLATLASARAQTTFTKITEGDLVNDQSRFTGCAWGDFNNDGLLDLFVASYGGTNVLYQNNGNGAFNKVSPGDLVTDIDFHTGATVGDYDNDGYLDLLVSAGQQAPTAHRNILYHNNGDGTFSRVSGGSVTNQLGYFRANAWVDYDNDGFLDLFVPNLGDSSNDGGKKLLFHNNGDGTFIQITSGAVVNDVSVAFSVQWSDYDKDGFMDLLVVNNPNNSGNSVNFLYHNEGNGTFTRVLTNSVATDRWSVGAICGAWGDYDNDGFQDLFITADGDGNHNRLYHNNGDGTFTNITSGAMLDPPAGGFSIGCVWGDYDNDGFLDLFVSNAEGQNGLFHNNGDGTFTQVLDGDPVNDGGSGFESRFCSWVDYDNDGFLDLYFQVAPDADSSSTMNHLYHNDGNNNTWLEVKCVGTVANRSAIGTKVRVKATIGGKTFWQLREINNSGGGENVIPLVAHFGLGQATNAEALRIEWPSGTVQEFPNVAAKQILTIIEPPRLKAGALLPDGSFQLSLTGGIGFKYDLETSGDLEAWTLWTTLTNSSRTVSVTDTTVTNVARRFYRAVSR